MTHRGDQEIHSVSGRFPDNPGELVYMRISKWSYKCTRCKVMILHAQLYYCEVHFENVKN